MSKVEVTIKKVASENPNISKRDISYDVYHNGKYHTTFKDINDALDHKEKTHTEDVDINETLNLQQRQKRAMIMRRYEKKIERSREISRKKLATESNIKKRAYAKARNIVRRKFAGERGADYEKLGPTEKIAVDKLIEKKQGLIQKLALRLIPAVRQAEQKRLQSYLHGKSLENHGAKEGNIREAYSSSPIQQSTGGEKPLASKRKSVAPIPTKDIKAERPDKAEYEFYNKFDEELESNSGVYKSLVKKSTFSGIDLNILGEVYNRGYNNWNDALNETAEQYAFSRVNSYIAKGKAYDADSDLRETIDAKLNNNFKSFFEAKKNEADPCWTGYKQIGTKKGRSGKQVPNCVKEEVELDESAAAGLAEKSKKSGVSLSILRKVYARGVAAWNSGHRPGTTPQQWGMARVNSYITKGKGTYHGADKDLREGARDKETGLPSNYVAGLSSSTAEKRKAHWKKMSEYSDKDPRAYEPAPGDATAKTKESIHTKKYKDMFGEAKKTKKIFTAAELKAMDDIDESNQLDEISSGKSLDTLFARAQKTAKAKSDLYTNRTVDTQSKFKSNDRKLDASTKRVTNKFGKSSSDEIQHGIQHSKLAANAPDEQSKKEYTQRVGYTKSNLLKKVNESEHTNCGTPECCNKCNPGNREVGTSSLSKIYKSVTPGQNVSESDGPVVWKKGSYSVEKLGNDKFALYKGKTKTKMFTSLDSATGSLNESFEMAFDYQGKPSIAPTAGQLMMKAQGGFEFHKDVQNVMEVTDIKNQIQKAFEVTILEENEQQLSIELDNLIDLVNEAMETIDNIRSSTVDRDAWSEAQIIKLERYIHSVAAYIQETAKSNETKGVVVPAYTRIGADGKLVTIPGRVKKVKTGRTIVNIGDNPNDGE
jgi:hypothetical protein